MLDPELGFGLQAAPWVLASSCHGEVPLSALGFILLGCQGSWLQHAAYEHHSNVFPKQL